jgi:hypothetical protein
MVALLLTHGADPNARNAREQTSADIVAKMARHYRDEEPENKNGEGARARDLCLKLLYRYGGTHNPSNAPDKRP